MLLQSDRTLPPPGVAPDFVALGKQAREAAVPNQWISIPASTFNVGLEDPENDDAPDRYFGWDNEKPRRLVNMPAFQAQARPLTNEDYAHYLYHTGQDAVPASWTSVKTSQNMSGSYVEKLVNGHSFYQNGLGPPLTKAYLIGKSVRTVYGPIPLEHALDWPIFASYDELSRCAAWMNGRIPSVEEVRSIYNYVDRNKNKNLDSINTKKISAVNGQVSNSFPNLCVVLMAETGIFVMTESRFLLHHTLCVTAPLAQRSPLTPTNYSLILKAATWASSTFTRCLSPRTAISCLGRETWAVYGNGQARRWRGMKVLNP